MPFDAAMFDGKLAVIVAPSDGDGHEGGGSERERGAAQRYMALFMPKSLLSVDSQRPRPSLDPAPHGRVELHVHVRYTYTASMSSSLNVCLSVSELTSFQGWQQKLSQLDVARFPWDPKPDPPAPAQPAQPPPQPAAAQPIQQPAAQTHTQATFSPQPPQQQTPQPHNNGIKPDPDSVKSEPMQNVPVKQETPGHIAMPPPMSFGGMDGGQNNVASNRAAHLLQQRYGDRAVGSVNAIQHSHQTQGQPQQGQAQDPQAAYRQHMAQQAAAAQQQQQQQQHGSNGQGNLHNAQTDGAFDAESDEEDDDFEAVLLKKTNGNIEELGRVEIDRLIHDRIASQAKAMEGGGLMVPLKEATRHKTARNADRKGKGPAQHDGGDDGEEYDEDAINSDLDDPEDGGSDDEVDDEGLGHIMLCMYDKVQRVKNKW